MVESKYRDDGNGVYWEGTPEEEQAYLSDPVRIQTEIVTAVQTRLDDFARTKNYDGILSLCTYASSTNPAFASEGQAGVDLRDATWAKLYQITGEVQAGIHAVPTCFADIEAELPVLEW